MKIGNIHLKNNLILAPMASVTDVAFRSLAVQSGASFAVSEMVSAKALMYENKRTLDLLNTTDVEVVKAVQIFGHDPEIMANACKNKHLQKFDIIDINMGCPAPKIVKNGDGCAMMRDINLASEVIKACVAATKKPITVKFRLGWDDSTVNAVEFAKMCERSGAAAITVHGRVREQFYGGQANYSEIAKVVRAVNIPVIANGDVVDKESYKKIIKATNCSAVMVGRAALGNPSVFYKILGKKDKHPKSYYIKQHIEILKKYHSDDFLSKYMKKHLLWYLKNEKNTRDIKLLITKSNNINDMLAEVLKFLEKSSN